MNTMQRILYICFKSLTTITIKFSKFPAEMANQYSIFWNLFKTVGCMCLAPHIEPENSIRHLCSWSAHSLLYILPAGVRVGLYLLMNTPQQSCGMRRLSLTLVSDNPLLITKADTRNSTSRKYHRSHLCSSRQEVLIS